MTYVVHFTPSAKMDLLKARDFYSKVDLELGKEAGQNNIVNTEGVAGPSMQGAFCR